MDEVGGELGCVGGGKGGLGSLVKPEMLSLWLINGRGGGKGVYFLSLGVLSFFSSHDGVMR